MMLAIENFFIVVLLKGQPGGTRPQSVFSLLLVFGIIVDSPAPADSRPARPDAGKAAIVAT
jgi:hypothetical protein